LRQNTLTCNHVGELAAVPSGVHLTAIDLGVTLLADVVCSPATSLYNFCPPTVGRRRHRYSAWYYSLQTSGLGRPGGVPQETCVDELVDIYDAELRAVIDRLAPTRAVTVRRRPFDPWYDDERRIVKRAARAARRSHLPDEEAAWRTRRRDFFHLLKTKRELFWRHLVVDACDQLRVLWSAFTTLPGRGRAPVANQIDAAVFYDLFDNKFEFPYKVEAVAHACLPGF
jgi:hypothetical protein